MKKQQRFAELIEIEREYKSVSNKVRALTRQARREFEGQLAVDSKENPKAVYAYMNNKTKVHTGIGKLCKDPLDKHSEVTDDDSEKADILSKYFASVLTVEPEGPVPILEDRPVTQPMPEILITTEKVLKILSNLKVNKTPGFDEYPPRVLKELAPFIAETVTVIFNKSLTEAALPSDWKTSVIAAIFKKGLTNLASNYRPVALTSILCKVLETLVRDIFLRT